MSYTSVYELFKTKANCIAELRNGHGSGPAVWDYISFRVLGKKFDMFNDKEFWPCYKSDKLSWDEKAVLLATYDKAFVEIENLQEFANACRKVHGKIIETTHWEWSHFESIADAAENLHKNHDYRSKGMAIGCTSVNDEWSYGNVKDIESWGVYSQIESMKKELN